MTATQVGLPTDSTQAQTGGWVEIAVKQDSRAAELLGYRSYWIEGSVERAASVMLQEYGITPGVPFCPCPLHEEDEIVVIDHGPVQLSDLAGPTRSARNAIIDRNGVEVQKPANPREHRNPYRRNLWVQSNQYRSLRDFIFEANNSRFMFATPASYEEARRTVRR